jgi:hypothetical protein
MSTAIPHGITRARDGRERWVAARGDARTTEEEEAAGHVARAARGRASLAGITWLRAVAAALGRRRAARVPRACAAAPDATARSRSIGVLAHGVALELAPPQAASVGAHEAGRARVVAAPRVEPTEHRGRHAKRAAALRRAGLAVHTALAREQITRTVHREPPTSTGVVTALRGGAFAVLGARLDATALDAIEALRAVIPPARTRAVLGDSAAARVADHQTLERKRAVARLAALDAAPSRGAHVGQVTLRAHRAQGAERDVWLARRRRQHHDEEEEEERAGRCRASRSGREGPHGRAS